MDGFQYKYGDRPLEGYTAQRAVGRGGFGEVYYALSDSGREVALKVVQGYEQIELRGVSQCMNLKSPHLVTIFDVKHNDQGTPFVIMEYVAGASLRDLLDESPGGLGPQKAAFFLRETAKGLTFLHDRGIVHRDLKPGNIFYEDGYVKIGDYGLSKAMSASQHSAQTITVGTVHYMAPEIGKGRYDRSIDIYALGVVLYEMLTGQVPFFGASHGEILMKHLMAEPDLSGVEEPFATVIRKAMAKEPADRYQSVQEMVEAVFGAEHIQQSVSHFRPESLSMVAERAARKVAVGGAGSSGQRGARLDAGRPPGHGSSDVWQDVNTALDRVGERLGAVGERMAQAGSRLGRRLAGHTDEQRADRHTPPAAFPADAVADPLDRRQRRRLWLLTTAVMAIGTGVLSAGGRRSDPMFNAVFTAGMIFGASVGIGRMRDKLLARLQTETGLVRHLAFGGAACAGAFLLGGLLLMNASHNRQIVESFLPVLGGLFLIDWVARASASRSERVSLGQAFSAGLLGFVLTMIFDGSAILAIGILAGVSMAVQAGSPFSPGAAKVSRRRKDHRHQRFGPSGAEQRPAGGPLPPPASPHPPGPPPPPGAPHIMTPGQQVGTTIAPPRVPPGLRLVSFLLFLGLLGLGLVLLIWAGWSRLTDDEFAAAVAGGCGALMFSLFFMVKTLQATCRSLWSGVIKPLLMVGCLVTSVTAAIFLGNVRMSSDEELVTVFLIVFPNVLFIVIACIPNRAIHALLSVKPAATEAGSDDRPVRPFGAVAEIPGRPQQGDPQAQGQAAAPETSGGEPADGSEPAGPPAGQPATTRSGTGLKPRLPRNLTAVLLALVAGILLLTGYAIGLAVAVNLPGMIAAGLPDPDLADELGRDVFGYAGWPELLERIGKLVSIIVIVLATTLLLIARRHAGAAHSARAVLGGTGLLLSLRALKDALHFVRWSVISGMVNSDQVGPAIEAFLDAVDDQAASIAGVLLLASILMLAWPPRREGRNMTPEGREGG